MTKKRTIKQRLNIIKGQIEGLARLIENEEDCKKVITQFHAIYSSLKKTMEIYFKENLSSCLKSLNSKNKKKAHFLIEQLIKKK